MCTEIHTNKDDESKAETDGGGALRLSKPKSVDQ